MNRLVRAELLKVRTTRTSVLLALAGIAFAAFLGFVNASLAGKEGNPALGGAAMVENVVGVSTIPAAFAVLLGVLLAAGEHQHGTITTTFLVEPRRHLVVAAKAAAAAVTATVVTVAMVVAAVAGALPRVVAEDAGFDVGGGAVRVVGGLLLASVLLAVVGVLLGHLLRSQVASLVLVLLWFTLLEAIADTLAGGSLNRWLPGGAAATLAGGGNDPLWSATLVLAAWTAAGAVVAVPAVVRRDVE